jgi:2-methylcitrate dehydratase PrpD
MAIGDLPPEVVTKTKLCILDTIGCMLAGSRDRVGATIAAHVLRHGPPGPCTVFGDKGSVGPDDAALANGASAHVLDFDDGHRPSGDHIGSAVVPPALAMAQATGATGSELLLSVTLGYDVMGRVGESVCLPRGNRYFHGNGTTGTFGAAAAAGRLLGLNAGQLANALGIAGDGASGLREFRPTGADCKALHVGRAGQTGITAAFLAAEGFQGSATILEGPYGFCNAMSSDPRPELICVELGQRFAVIESGFKIYPCVGTLHLPIEAALELRKEHDLNAGSIQRITIALPDWARGEYASRERPPSTVGNARFSMPFTIAAALHDGEVTSRQFTQAKLVDPGIARLERLVQFVPDPGVQRIFEAQKPDEPFFFIPCIVEIESAGTTFRKLVQTPPGYDPKGRGLGQEQVLAKFRGIADGILSPESANRMLDWAMGLDHGSRIDDFARLV